MGEYFNRWVIFIVVWVVIISSIYYIYNLYTDKPITISNKNNTEIIKEKVAWRGLSYNNSTVLNRTNLDKKSGRVIKK